LAFLLALLVVAASGRPVGAEPRERTFLDRPRLLDDPLGWRSRLEQLGVGLQLFYNQVLAWKPPGGGANPSGVFGHSASYDFLTRVDVEELAGWPGLDLLLHVKGQYERNLNKDVGALSNPIDDADFDEPVYVDELWLQQEFFDGRARLRAGFMEQQTVFDRNAYANAEDRQFLTTFLDNNPLVPLPNGLAAVLLIKPFDRLELAVGAADADNAPRRAGFDTAFDGIDSVTGYLEITYWARLPAPRGSLPGSYRVGMFLDARDREVFGRSDPSGLPRKTRGHLGAYLSVDQVAFREGGEGSQGLGVFARFGYADPDVNRIEWFWSVGGQYEGPLPCRDRDILGLGVYQAIGSSAYRREIDPEFERETGLELYYRIAVLPWLTVTPDFQYVFDPGASGLDDTAVLALRFRVTF
jgi:porin